MAEYRPWHLPGCPARDCEAVTDEDVERCCTCPAERWLDPWALPVAGPEPGPYQADRFP